MWCKDGVGSHWGLHVNCVRASYWGGVAVVLHQQNGVQMLELGTQYTVLGLAHSSCREDIFPMGDMLKNL